MAFSVGQIQFLDSFQFTMKSLDNLVGTLNEDDFMYTRQLLPDDEKFYLMTRRGVFPYDFFDNIRKLQYTSVPSREAFFSTLSNQECPMKDYLNGKLVWNTFNCQSFRDYHNLYLKSDVLLTDFFEKFRKLSMDSYGLDAAHYYTAPGMAWDAALKLTNVKLELFDNEDMYTFIERSIRGGISQISKRFAKANNKDCPDYDPLKSITHLIYLNANNLYGWAMSQFLPTHGFRWLTQDEINYIIIKHLADDSEDGYIFEVDLTYPESLHPRHSDYPLAPERLTIDESMLSSIQQKFPAHQKKASTKLTPNLYDKKNYVVHYLQQGLVITKIHRVLAFKQSPWLKTYIDFSTQMRANSSSTFAKDVYMFMNNSVFGKTQENLRNRVNVEVVTKRDVALKRACRPSFKRSMTIQSDLVVMQNAVSNLELNKPVYIGFSILDLSKLRMYKFHYEKLPSRHEDNIRLCFIDTDTLLYEIDAVDIFQDMAEYIDD